MKQALYLETSVIGAYLDNGEPFRRDLTIRWWEHEMPDYRTVVSPLVSAELGRLKDPHRNAYLKLITNLEQVDLTEEAAILAEGYIARGIFHRKYIADALHVAIASFHKRTTPGTHQAVQHSGRFLCSNDRDAGVSGVRSNRASELIGNQKVHVSSPKIFRSAACNS